MARKLKFGSPAWRKKYLKGKAKKKRSNPRKRAVKRAPRKKKTVKRRNSAAGLKAKKARLREMIREAQGKKNPPLKKLKKSTGWMKVKAVKIVKRGGQATVLVKR